jgi:hypothetical protein
MEMIDPEKLIIRMPPGSAVYAVTHRPEAHLDFLVREKSNVIRNRLRNPIVTIRPGLFIQDGVGLLTVMFLLGSDMEQLYETWFNYRASGQDGEQILDLMTTQENIAFHLYGDSLKVEKSVVINNSIGGFFTTAAAEIRKLPPWSMQQFDRARDVIYRKHPSPEALWKALFNQSMGN